jgi:hypothetical protein
MPDEDKKEEAVADPATSALVLAGRAAGEVVTPKLRELLLGRIAAAYGEHWGAEAEERLRRRREEKRLQNAHAHARSMSQLKPQISFEDVSDDPLFDEWLAGAAAVDGTVDPELGDFWRAALLALANGDRVRVRLLRIVQSLEADDAVFLATGRVTGGRFRPAPDFAHGYGYTRRAEQAGILTSSREEFRRRPGALFASICLPLFTYAIVTVWPFLPDKRLDPDAVSSLAIPAALFSLAISATVLAVQLTSPARGLTPDGTRLLGLLDRVRSGARVTDAPMEDQSAGGGHAGPVR